MDILKGRRIFVLEEHLGIATLLADMIMGFGCEVVGPVQRLDDAMDLIVTSKIDAAILDVAIKGEVSFPIADRLIQQGTPYAFASGNKTAASIERYAGVIFITKPYSEQHICKVLCDLIGGRA
jgi:two-component SAPR family response regulator